MSPLRSISSLGLLLFVVAARALSQDEYSKPISWSFELPASTTVVPFSRPLDTAADSGITRADPLKQSISDNVGSFLNSNEIHLDAAGQQHPSQPAAPYLKPWPPIKWPVRPSANEQRVTFADGLNTTMPWSANSSNSDWSSRITPSATDAAAENYLYIGQQVGSGQPDQVAIAPTDLNFSNHLASPSQPHGNAINAHALNYLSLLTKPTHHLDPSNPLDWTRFGELAQRTALPPVQFLRPPDHKQPGWQKTQFSGKKQAGPAAKSAWFKPFAPKRRSYETISELNQYSPRTAATSVYFDDSLEAINRPRDPMEQASGDGQLKTNKDYLSASYASLPVIYETGAPMAIERKNSKLEAQDDQLNSLIDSFASGSKYSQISASMPTFYGHASYPALHHMPVHTTHRKGLEKSLGVSILVGIGAALISFLIISNLFLSVPLFAMTLMQLLNGSPMLMPNNNNNNGNNQVPNNNNNPIPNNNNNPSTNGRKRRHIQDIEFEERIQKVLSDSSRY